jgi:hypothetical protein
VYTITDYEVIDGEKFEIKPIKGGFFESIAQIDNYQNILTEYEQSNYPFPISVLVHYKVPISEHIPHK